MAFRHLTRNFFQCVKQTHLHSRFFSTIQRTQPLRRCDLIQQHLPIRAFSSVQTNANAYRDLETFLQKEIQLEKSAQQHPSKLPTITGFQETKEGPEVTLTRQTGNDKVVVKFNVTNTVNASDAEPELEAKAGEQEEDSKSQLKSRPSFTVEISRAGQTLSFLCSFLPNDYAASREQLREMAKEENQGSEPEDWLEDFQIDEFTIHEGEWNEKIYSSDCSVIDGELYDKLLNVLEEHGIGEEFANQLIDYATAYEHHQYIGLLEKLQKFVKK